SDAVERTSGTNPAEGLLLARGAAAGNHGLGRKPCKEESHRARPSILSKSSTHVGQVPDLPPARRPATCGILSLSPGRPAHGLGFLRSPRCETSCPIPKTCRRPPPWCY